MKRRFVSDEDNREYVIREREKEIASKIRVILFLEREVVPKRRCLYRSFRRDNIPPPICDSLLSVFTLMDLLKRIDVKDWYTLVLLNSTTARLFCNKNTSPYQMVVKSLLEQHIPLIPKQSSEWWPLDRPWTLVHRLIGVGRAIYTNMNQPENLEFLRHLIAVYAFMARGDLDHIPFVGITYGRTTTLHGKIRKATFIAGCDVLRFTCTTTGRKAKIIVLTKNGFQYLWRTGELTGHYCIRLETLATIGRQFVRALLQQTTKLQVGFTPEWTNPFIERYIARYGDCCT